MNPLLIFVTAFLDDIVTWLAHRFSLVDVTMWGIQLVGTIPERILLFLACSIAITAILVPSRLARSASVRFLAPVIGAFVVFRVLYHIFWHPHATAVALALALVMAAIQIPSWRRSRTTTLDAPTLGVVGWLFSVVLVPSLAAVLLHGWSLQGLAQRLHRDESVQWVAQIDLNALALDAENGLLYAAGHGTDYLLAYDLNDLSRTPRSSPVTTNKAQSFYYNPVNQELYLFRENDRALLFIEARTLSQNKSVTGLDMTNGDVRLAYDRLNDAIILVSEGMYWGSLTESKGYPVAVVARKTGQLLYTLRDCGELCIPGLIHTHPTKPLLYLAFPKTVRAYDLNTRRVVGTSAVKGRWVDGMAITPDGKELLVGVPLHSEVLRFDAESLELNGSIATVFGVRTLAVDSERNLLLTASLATNMLDVIDLKTYRRVGQYYVAPWLHDISLDTKAGFAYVSSTEGLFRVQYTSRLGHPKN
jgi:DNA-binding beta-propeller fold protein YncE